MTKRLTAQEKALFLEKFHSFSESIVKAIVEQTDLIEEELETVAAEDILKFTLSAQKRIVLRLWQICESIKEVIDMVEEEEEIYE